MLSGKTSHAISGIIKRMCNMCTLYVYSLGDCPSDILQGVTIKFVLYSESPDYCLIQKLYFIYYSFIQFAWLVGSKVQLKSCYIQ